MALVASLAALACGESPRDRADSAARLFCNAARTDVNRMLVAARGGDWDHVTVEDVLATQQSSRLTREVGFCLMALEIPTEDVDALQARVEAARDRLVDAAIDEDDHAAELALFLRIHDDLWRASQGRRR